MTPLEGGAVVGKVEMVPLADVRNNGWNPNEMTREVFASLKHGLGKDGWLASQALLVWRTDETGASKMLIIDGEHRWRVGTELGFKKGPMVFLDGLTEAKAKSLTIAMNQRRGAFDDAALGALLREIQYDLAAEDSTPLGEMLGFDEEKVMGLLAEAAVELAAAPPRATAGPAPVPPVAPPMSDVRVVQLFLDDDQREEFGQLVADLAPVLGVPVDAHVNVNVVSEAAHRAAHPAPHQA